MVFKVNIGNKGKTYKVETDNEDLIGKKIGETISGSDVSADLKGYELEIRGTSDKAGFPGMSTQNGPGLRKVLFTKGKFLHKVKNKGFRRKKSVRGNEISAGTVQINCTVTKSGSADLEKVFAPKSEEPEKTE